MSFDLSLLGWHDGLEALLPDGAVPARVARVHRGAAEVLAADGEHHVRFGARVRRAAADDPIMLPCVGDWAALAPLDEGRHELVAVLPRTTAFLRGGVSRDSRGGLSGDGQGQVLAANVDVDREMILLPDGGLIIDTPGIRRVGLYEMSDGVDRVFSDIEELAEGCRFSDCRHRGEPGCAATRPASGRSSTRRCGGPEGVGRNGGYDRPMKRVRLPFTDRAEAGTLLAEVLSEMALEDPVVLALPRGGVAVAAPVSERLAAPLDVLVTRKIGCPGQPELGVGAIAEGGEPVFDRELLHRLGFKPEDVAEVVERERRELARRVRVYRGDRPLPPLGEREVVVVDDGLATGGTARAALRAVRARQEGSGGVTLAVPVAAGDTVESMRSEADEVVVLATPAGFRAVGQWYECFDQLTDDDVLDLLAGEPRDEPG